MLGDYLCYCGKEFKTFEDWFWHDEEFGCNDIYLTALSKIELKQPLTIKEERIVKGAVRVKLNRAWQAEKADGFDKLLLEEKIITDKLNKEIIAFMEKIEQEFELNK